MECIKYFCKSINIWIYEYISINANSVLFTKYKIDLYCKQFKVLLIYYIKLNIENLISINSGTTSGIGGQSELSNAKKNKKVDIFIQKRNARKCITSIQNLDKDNMNLKKFVKSLRKKFSCNGHISKDEKLGDVVVFQGDHREKIKLILVSDHGYEEEDIILHGA